MALAFFLRGKEQESVSARTAGIDLARAYNDALAEACTRHPTRYRGFAHPPLLAPAAAAEGLERTARDLGFHGVLVNGATHGRFLDDPAFEPLLVRAEALDLPIYLHPGIPTPDVRNAYFDNLSAARSTATPASRPSSATWARRCPSCWTGSTKPRPTRRRRGSGARCGRRWSIRCGSRPAEFFTMVPFMAALMSFGADRILFSADYPFASNARARAFLDALPVSPADRAKIAHGNADRLLRLPG